MNLFKLISMAVLTSGIAITAMAAPSVNQPTHDNPNQRAERIAKLETEKAALFQQADANRDGKLSAPEFTRYQELQKNAWQARKQEFEKNRFARIDTNKDGSLSLDELKAAQAQRVHFKHHRDGSQHPQKPAL